ncbi:MAG: 4Fe-4S dicluster domain-containing protein [Vicinamibacterales bacterium]|jgi:molybdopterin-containing oxidoreductase family iron-sulfur binding subunit|nr:4Fe-4S dicluster domain-containing protein [Vicinamibacterales bacterium]
MNPNEISARPDTPGMDRREFLRVGGALAAAGALASAGCQVPQEATIPFHDMPENLVDGIGRARFFHTVLDGSPVVVKTREGRPILVTPSQDDASGRGLSVRHHAALMDLYDPDRAAGPLSVRRGKGAPVASGWAAISPDVVSRLKTAGTKAVLLTGPIDSPSLSAAIAGLTAQTGLRHVAWSPIESDAASVAWREAFGGGRIARPRLDRADLIVGLGAEFLDRPEDGLEREFAARRSPDGPATGPSAGAADGSRGEGGMSRFVQLEGRLTLTGANADRRIRVRDSHLARVAAALAHELIVVRRLGPLAADAEVGKVLAPFAIDAVAAQAGLGAEVLKALAGELAAASGRALVVAGGSSGASASGPAIELASLILNITLGAFDAGLLDEAAAAERFTGGGAALSALVEEMAAGRVEMLIVAGVNPAYDAPAFAKASAELAPDSSKFAEALAKVPFVVSLNDRLDETSLLADMLAPTSHPFECWGDASLPNSLAAIQQPVIQPLHDTRGVLDVLVEWGAAAGDPAAFAAVTAAAASAAKAPLPATAAPATSPSAAWHYLRAAWGARLALDPATPAFEAAWNEVLRAGQWGPSAFAAPAAASARPASATRTIASSAFSMLAALEAGASAGLELQLYPHFALADGRGGNNGWLNELPDPITRITWGGALSIAPRRFDEMKIASGDLVEIDAGHAKVVAPAYRHAGMHYDQVALPLGLGRTACGAIGAGVGPNAYPLRRFAAGRVISAGLPVTIRKVDGNEALAFGQGSDVIDRDRRPLVPVTTLSAYEQNPKAGTEQQHGGPSIWSGHEFPSARWAMAIDLSKCNGCGKCVIGCQAENNIPVVGRQGMLDGREMSWMRIDRYYDAPKKDGQWDADVWDGPLEVVEDPQTLFEPMLCQHCENAPCETVCPFVATMHSADGLNQQIYNRCVGTRYCANNCPFKVRRYNFWEMSKKQESAFFRWLVPRIARNAELNTRVPMQMKNNPEVTVRSRGVMEKCSFCIQRIRAAASEAVREGRSKDHFPDGAVVPACMEACPTGAITFGDVNHPGSRVAALAAHPRAMRLLDALGVKPSISYLTKVRHDKA